MSWFTCAVLGITLTSCSKDSNPPPPSENQLYAGNIVGGTRSTDDFQKKNGIVAIVIDPGEDEEVCTGTLISKRLVLTAAHCLKPMFGPLPIKIVFSKSLDLAKPATTRSMVNSIIHQDFIAAAFGGKAVAWNDIALIKLDADAPEDFSLVTLPVDTANLVAKTKLTQAGFGSTVADRKSRKNTFGTLRQVSAVEITELFDDGKEFLVAEKSKGSCSGDSGGPAFVQNKEGRLVQIGIDSRGRSSDSCLGVGVYTNVAVHLNWIRTESDILMQAE